jgi:DHA2 family multidrug resistance protein
MVTRSTQRRQNYMAAHMQNGNPMFRQMVEGMSATLRHQGMSAGQATRQAYGRIAMLMGRQANALAFKDVVAVLAVVVACLIPLAFIMKKPPGVIPGDAPPPH